MTLVAWDVLLAAGCRVFPRCNLTWPKFLMVLRNTMIGGRRQGVMCALGHGLGFGLYAGMAVFGLIVLLEEAPVVFTALQLVGCGLLAWYGWSTGTPTTRRFFTTKTPQLPRGSLEGFAIAFFNPKIALVSRGRLGSSAPTGHEPPEQNRRGLA